MPASWIDIGQGHLSAAKQLAGVQPRSSVSRAYYAVHVVLASNLISRGYVPPKGRETQPHDAQPALIGRYLSHLGKKRVADLRSIVRRTYKRRLDADYRRTVKVGALDARDSLREASSFFAMLNVR